MKYSFLGAASLVLVAACHHAASATSSGAPAAQAAAAPAKPALPAAVTPANVALGDSLFNSGSCQRCHGMAGVGAANAPALNDQTWLQLTTGSFEEIQGIITTGVPADKIKDATHRNPMGARGGRMALTDPQITALAAYVYTLSHK